MNTIIAGPLAIDAIASAATGIPSYEDERHGVRVHLVDASSPALQGRAGVLMDDTTARDGLFLCISQGLPLERRANVVHSLIVHWACQFDAAHANGETVVTAVDL